jgi:very-short-patch-repair endonuclease
MRCGLAPLQPGTWAAASQPQTVELALEALRHGPRDYVVMGALALWLHLGGEPPAVGLVGVRHTRRLPVRPPLRLRRACVSVLAGSRIVGGHPVVAVEVATIQAAAARDPATVLRLVERLLRERRTTIFRLRARCRRGLAGSAAVRAACDELAGGSLERAVRLLRRALELRGVEGLETEVRFESASGAAAYADLRHGRTRTSIEVDGYLDHAELQRFRTDRRRDRWLRTEHGETVLRVAADEVWRELDALADELAGYLLRPQSQAATG